MNNSDTLSIQFMGRLVGTIQAPADLTKSELETFALASDLVKKQMQGKRLKEVIVTMLPHKTVDIIYYSL